MDQLLSVVGTTALLGSAVVGGIFFAFSSFVMRALARLPGAHDMWERYLTRWTAWNHLRTAAAMAAALLFCLGLQYNGGA